MNATQVAAIIAAEREARSDALAAQREKIERKEACEPSKWGEAMSVFHFTSKEGFTALLAELNLGTLDLAALRVTTQKYKLYLYKLQEDIDAGDLMAALQPIDTLQHTSMIEGINKKIPGAKAEALVWVFAGILVTKCNIGARELASDKLSKQIESEGEPKKYHDILALAKCVFDGELKGPGRHFAEVLRIATNIVLCNTGIRDKITTAWSAPAVKLFVKDTLNINGTHYQDIGTFLIQSNKLTTAGKELATKLTKTPETSSDDFDPNNVTTRELSLARFAKSFIATSGGNIGARLKQNSGTTKESMLARVRIVVQLEKQQNAMFSEVDIQ
jgi:hypothetical protein